MKIRHILKEAAGVTAAFAFGRFNPAHQGHIAVWQTVQNAGVKWYIGTNPSTIGPNDPLSFEQKSAWMQAIYPAIAGHIAPEQSVVTLAARIYKDLGNKEDATIAYITDETDWAWSGKLLNQYNGVEGRHGYYKFAQIVHVPSPRVSSATALRDAARADDKVAFYQASGTDPKIRVEGKTYFDTVKEACTAYPLPVKRGQKVKEQGVAEGAPIVIAQAPHHIRNPQKNSPQHKPPTAYQQGIAAQGKPYDNPYPFDPKASSEANYDHNQYRAGYKKQSVAEGSTGVSVRGWANQVRRDHGADVKFSNRKEGGGAVDSVIARNSQGETVGVYNRKTGYPTVYEPKQSVDESRPYWSDLPNSMSVDDKISFFEQFFIKGNLTESNTEQTVDYFKSIIESNPAPIKGKSYIAVPLMLVNDQLQLFDKKPQYLKFISQDNTGFLFTGPEGEVNYPPKRFSNITLTHTFTFSTATEYNEFRTMIRLRFELNLPTVNITEASLATMRDYFAGDKNAKDKTKLSQMRDYFSKQDGDNKANVKTKEFDSIASYVRWAEKNKITPFTNRIKEDEHSGIENVTKSKNLIPFPQGTTLVKVSDTYDWYKLGQVISDLDDADPAIFGQGAPETILAFGSEEEEHKLLPLLKRMGLKLKDIDQPVSEAYKATDLFEYLRKIHKRWAIVSKKEGRPLVYFKGEGKPSKEWVKKQERRINTFKNKK